MIWLTEPIEATGRRISQSAVHPGDSSHPLRMTGGWAVLTILVKKNDDSNLSSSREVLQGLTEGSLRNVFNKGILRLWLRMTGWGG